MTNVHFKMHTTYVANFFPASQRTIVFSYKNIPCHLQRNCTFFPKQRLINGFSRNTKMHNSRNSTGSDRKEQLCCIETNLGLKKQCEWVLKCTIAPYLEGREKYAAYNSTCGIEIRFFAKKRISSRRNLQI